MRTRGLMAIALAGALVLAGCGDGDDEATPTSATSPTAAASPTGAASPTAAETSPAAAGPAALDVTATDDGAGGGYAFALPDTVPAGATQITLSNSGAEPHHAQLFKLNDDATMDDLTAQLATGDPAAMLQVGIFTGGTGTVAPGSTSEADAIIDLTEGTYAFMCFVEGEAGPHVANGMLQPFEVTAADDAAPAPDPDGEISLINYGFELPDEIAGDATLTVTNASENEPHEVNIMRLAEGSTLEDVQAFFTSEGPPAGPPPVLPVGGMQAMVPGASEALQLDVSPGNYVFVCFIPSVDPTNEGASHAELGMIREVAIS